MGFLELIQTDMLNKSNASSESWGYIFIVNLSGHFVACLCQQWEQICSEHYNLLKTVNSLKSKGCEKMRLKCQVCI